MLKSEDKKSILKYRIEKSWLSLKEAKDVAALGYWNLAGNRIYYAVYYMASALLLDKGFITKTHAGVIHLLGAKFISEGMLDKSYGRFFSRLYELRQAGDYDDMYDATPEEVEPYFDTAEKFISEMEELITLK